MALEELQGKTLGEKHKHYNELVKKAIDGDHSIQVDDFNTADYDVTNLIKIDIAGKKRNVEYILKILQCQDLLYVFRAIKQSNWLITDRQYSHIINPRYLHSQLFPNMTSKACAKLLLNIRIHLKDEDRVDEFYNFLKEKDIQVAVFWLPNCSLPLAEQEVAKHTNILIERKLRKRLYEKSITLLEIIIKNAKDDFVKDIYLREAMYLLERYSDKMINNQPYLDFIFITCEGLSYCYKRFFGPKATSILMKKCPQRIMDNIGTYCEWIDMYTFVKHLKSEEIKELISKVLCERNDLKNCSKYENFNHFISYLPTESRAEVINNLISEHSKEPKLCYSQIDPGPRRNICKWYRFAPFNEAFSYLSECINSMSESSHQYYDCINVYDILISCANRNPEDIQTVLKHFLGKFIDASFDFQFRFVNILLRKADIFKFNETNWNALNEIFVGMKVYDETENDDREQLCIAAIILYNLLHKEKIPEIIDNKFKYEFSESFKRTLTDDERNIVFDELYKTLEYQIQNKNISSDNELTETVHLLENMQALLKHWSKNVVDFPWFLNKVQEIIKVKNTNSWKVNLASLITKNMSWRKIMFEESLLLCPSEETCYNALKHDPELLSRHRTAVEELRCNDNVSLRRVLRTLRVYWPKTLAADWTAWYLSRLDILGTNEAVIRGLCTLATQQQLMDVIIKYAPTESTIETSADNENEITIRKNLARHMHLSRPLLSPDVVMLYAKGDYLQFSLPSLQAVFHKMSAAQTKDHFLKMSDSPVSLLKYSLLFTYAKMGSEILFRSIWTESKNPAFRLALFEQARKLLCKQTDPVRIQKFWEVLSVFIENFSSEQDKTLYDSIPIDVDKIPLMVRGKYLMKCYSSLNSLPHDIRSEPCGYCNVYDEECNDPLVRLKVYIYDLMKHLEPEFVESVLLENWEKNFTTRSLRNLHRRAAYLLYAPDAETQTQRYEKVLRPVLDHCFASWDVKLYYDNDFDHDGYWARLNAIKLLKAIFSEYKKIVFEKKIFAPTKIFSHIEQQLEKWLPVEKHYKTQTTWKLITAYVKNIEEHLIGMLVADNDAKEIYLKALPKFSEKCLEYLRDDIERHGSSIYVLFAECLRNAFRDIDELVFLECLETLLKDETFIQSYLVVFKNVDFIEEHIAQLKNIQYEIDTYWEESIMERISIIREKIASNPSSEVKLHFNRTSDLPAH